MANKTTELLKRLLKKSERSELDWQPLADKSGFQVAFAKQAVRIRYSTPPSQGSTITLAMAELSRYLLVEIINERGEVIDRFRGIDITPNEAVALGATGESALKNLYSLASRKARGADEVIDAILMELEE